jgi:hypothetical protein
MATQLLAAHNATMECYRRAILPEQTSEGRSQNLNQANKLSRTYAVLLDALNRHRGKGQQKVTVEHVHVHSGGQAVVGMVGAPGGGAPRKLEDQPHASKLPMHLSCRCGARTRRGNECQSPAMPNGRCRLHGGKSPGAPKGNKNALKHGHYSADAAANRRLFRPAAIPPGAPEKASQRRAWSHGGPSRGSGTFTPPRAAPITAAGTPQTGQTTVDGL